MIERKFKVRVAGWKMRLNGVNAADRKVLMGCAAGWKMMARVADRKILMHLGALVCLLAVSVGIVYKGVCDSMREEEAYEALADSVIRMHVRAASDDESDQAVKMAVRSSVVEYLEPLLSGAADIGETREILESNIDGITECARAVLLECGSEDTVAAYLEQSFFAERVLGDVTFPAGVYETFRIDIGEAQGHNWWCILYPPVSVTDGSSAVISDESSAVLKNILTEDEYNAITRTYRFKYLKFLNFIFE